MTYTVCGYCQHCGKEMYIPHVWYGIYPPRPQPSCNCVNPAQPRSTPHLPSPPPPGSVPWYRRWDPADFKPVKPHQPVYWDDEYIQSLKENDADGDSNPRDTVQRKIAETRKVVEGIRRKQKEVEQDLSGIESLGQALDEEAPIKALEARIDRLETMMINLTQKLGDIKQILVEKDEEERRFADDGK